MHLVNVYVEANHTLRGQGAGVQFVPMIYGNCCGIGDPDSLPENATALLGFNEPNHM